MKNSLLAFCRDYAEAVEELKEEQKSAQRGG